MENEQQTSFNPYKSIWLQPRSTIQRIVDTNPTYLVLVLLALTGVANGVSAASVEGWGYDMSLLWVFFIIVAIFPLITILLLYLVSKWPDSLDWKMAGRQSNSRTNPRRLCMELYSNHCRHCPLCPFVYVLRLRPV